MRKGFVVLLLMCSVSWGFEPIRIHCVGDSITYGRDVHDIYGSVVYEYRDTRDIDGDGDTGQDADLVDWLPRESYRNLVRDYFGDLAVMVGSTSLNPNGSPEVHWAMSHSSQGGWGATTFNGATEGILSGWRDVECDFALVILGINDIFSQTADGEWNYDDLDRVADDVSVFLDNVENMPSLDVAFIGTIPYVRPELVNPYGVGEIGDAVNEGVEEYNDWLWQEADNRLWCVPVEQALHWDYHLDNVHPSDEGELELALGFTTAIMAHLTDNAVQYDFLPGDFNLDGKVDSVDLWSHLFPHYGTVGTVYAIPSFSQGNADGDNDVDFEDYLAWFGSQTL